MSKALENMSFDKLLEVTRKLESDKIELESKLRYMQFQIEQLNRLLFGTKRERFVPASDEKQMSLPFDVEPEPEQSRSKKPSLTKGKKSNEKTIPVAYPCQTICL